MVLAVRNRTVPWLNYRPEDTATLTGTGIEREAGQKRIGARSERDYNSAAIFF
jgi:hypothetical protein